MTPESSILDLIFSFRFSPIPEDFAEGDAATRQDLLATGSILESSLVLRDWSFVHSKCFAGRGEAPIPGRSA
jgi:hypothetical protein